MTEKDLIKGASQYCSNYFRESPEQLHEIFSKDAADSDEYFWKTIINAVTYSCNTAISLTVSYLLSNGLIVLPTEDTKRDPLS